MSLSVLLTELYLNIHFLVMAAQICIKMALGPFFQLVNIANRLLRFFSKLDTPIRSTFPRVHGNPIFRLDYDERVNIYVIRKRIYTLYAILFW